MAWYSTGSVSLTNGSSVVIGNGTQFITNTKSGDIFICLADGVIYEIDQILAATQLTLKRPFAGTTNATAQYEIVPTTSYLKTLATQVADLITLYQAVPQNTEDAQAAATAAQGYRDTAVTSATNAAASEANAAQWKTAAAGSATAAKTSETNSKTSETNAASSASAADGSKTAAATSATTAKTSETNAKTSETNAKTSETNAAASASAALASKTAAGTSETNAKTSETNAGNSASAAATSKTNADTSASNASNSAAAALASKGAAATSETNAKTSETNAKTSETNSASSASAAAASAAHADQVATTIGNPVAKAGDTMTGDLKLDATAGTRRNLGFLSGLKARWNIGKSGTAEAGSNAGSDLVIDAIADDGSTVIGTALSIVRSTMAATFAGAVSAIGAITSGSNTVTGSLNLNGPTAVSRVLFYKTAGVSRWAVYVNGTTESGTSTGSDFAINRYNNSGTLIDSPLTISRTTGVVNLPAATVGGLPIVSSLTGNKVYLSWSQSVSSSVSLQIDSTYMGEVVHTGTGTVSFSPGKTMVVRSENATYSQTGISLQSTSSAANLGFSTNSGSAGGILRFNGSGNAFEAVNFNSSGYANFVCAALTQTSDRALKTDIVDFTDQDLALLDGLSVKRYRLRSDGKPAIGVIAQEWQAAYPELIVDTGVEIDGDGDFIAHQYAPLVEVMQEVPVLDEDGNDTGATKSVGTGEFSGGEEIFGPNGKPESRNALGFNYGNSAALGLAGVINLRKRVAELEASHATLLQRIAALEAK